MPSRRPVDLSSFEQHVSLLKCKTGIARDESRKKMVNVPKDSLVPMIQADVGSAVPVDVARYRLLVPIAQLISSRSGEIKRVMVATLNDLYTLEKAFIRHLGGATVHLQEPSPIRGVGARDPMDAVGLSQWAAAKRFQRILDRTPNELGEGFASKHRHGTLQINRGSPH